jgi:anthranilate synthase component 2
MRGKTPPEWVLPQWRGRQAVTRWKERSALGTTEVALRRVDVAYLRQMPNAVLVLDNYDSFTYNLVQFLGELGERPEVLRNDAITVDEIASLAPRAIVLGPGPRTPREAGICIPAIRRYGAEIPILGVCLGHQAIGEAYGGNVVRAPRGVMHGKTSRIRHDGSDLFAAIPSPLEVMRYHSLVVERASLPDCLEVTATALDDASEIHAVRHRAYPVWGVQFHPESILTQHGKLLLRNFLTLAAAHSPIVAKT